MLNYHKPDTLAYTNFPEESISEIILKLEVKSKHRYLFQTHIGCDNLVDLILSEKSRYCLLLIFTALKADLQNMMYFVIVVCKITLGYYK